ncbi:hypothetical protein LTR27_010415 [Elasticomyces elasticus]|nr:hypothetical protein LTR27_010415 [Elasticomyces elasticus]
MDHHHPDDLRLISELQAQLNAARSGAKVEVYLGDNCIFQLPGIPRGGPGANPSNIPNPYYQSLHVSGHSALQHHEHPPQQPVNIAAHPQGNPTQSRELAPANGQHTQDDPPKQQVVQKPAQPSSTGAVTGPTTGYGQAKPNPRAYKTRDADWTGNRQTTNDTKQAVNGPPHDLTKEKHSPPLHDPLSSTADPTGPVHPKAGNIDPQSIVTSDQASIAEKKMSKVGTIGSDAMGREKSKEHGDDGKLEGAEKRTVPPGVAEELDSDLSPSQEGSDGKESGPAEVFKEGGKTGKLGHAKQQTVQSGPSDGSGAEPSQPESSKIVNRAEEKPDGHIGRKTSETFLRIDEDGYYVYQSSNGKERRYVFQPITIGKDDTGAVAKTWSPPTDGQRPRRKASGLTTAVAAQTAPRPAAARKVSKTPAATKTKTRQDSASKGKVKANSAPASRPGSVDVVAIAEAALNEIPAEEMHDISHTQPAAISKARSRQNSRKGRTAPESLRKKGESKSDEEDEDEDEDENEDEDFVKRPSQLDPVPEEDEYHVSAPRPLLPQSILMPAGNSNVHYQFQDLDRYSSFRPHRKRRSRATANTLHRNTREHDYENNSDDDDTQFSDHAQPTEGDQQQDQELETAFPPPPAADLAAPFANDIASPSGVKRSRSNSAAEEEDGTVEPPKKKSRKPSKGGSKPKRKEKKPKGQAVNGEPKY